MDHSKAQISVLQGLINRFQNGELVSEEETQRELEMVGLRERTILSSGISSGDGQGIDINDGNVRVGEEFKELRDVGWFEVIFGQKRRKSAEEEERQAQEEWTKGELAYLFPLVLRSAIGGNEIIPVTDTLTLT